MPLNKIPTIILPSALFFGLVIPAYYSQPSPRTQYLIQRREIIMENLANSDTTVGSTRKINLPYRRKVATWNPATKTFSITEDPSPFIRRYEPYHPFADQNGYVLYPNIDVQSELLDLLITQRELDRVP